MGVCKKLKEKIIVTEAFGIYLRCFGMKRKF